MKKLLLVSILSLLYNLSSAQQMAMTMEVKGDVTGLCDQSKVYTLYMMKYFSGNSAIEGNYPLSNEQLTSKLNEEISFLKKKPKHKDKFGVRIIVNCKGEVVSIEFENKTKSKELDEEILKIFRSLEGWTAGRFNGELVDSTKPYYFKIKAGEIEMD
jgi:hypothetical protein